MVRTVASASFTLAAEVEPGDVALARLGVGEGVMAALQRREQVAWQEATRDFAGDELVLAQEERMRCAQPFTLGLDVGAVRRQRRRHLAPGRLVVLARTMGIRGVAGAVRLHLAFEQGASVPGGPEQDRGRARAGGHGPELAVEPGFVDVLRLIGDEGDGGGVPGHARLRAGAEQHRPRSARSDRVAARAALPGGGHERVRRGQGGANALGADARLGVERGRADDDRAALAGVRAQEEGDESGGDLVLARLSRHHRGQGRAAGPAAMARRSAPQDARLIGAQGGAAEQGQERVGHGGKGRAGSGGSGRRG